MPISRSDKLVKKLIRELWKERDRLTEQIAGLSKLVTYGSRRGDSGTGPRVKRRRLALVKGRKKAK